MKWKQRRKPQQRFSGNPGVFCADRDSPILLYAVLLAAAAAGIAAVVVTEKKKNRNRR